MTTALTRRALAAIALALWVSPSLAFDLQVAQPPLRVQVADLPDITLAPQAAPAPEVDTFLAGQAGPLQATLAVSRASADMSTRLCAGVFLRSLVRQEGMPARDSIYRAPLNESTFVVLYLRGEEPSRVLHAHVLAAVDGSRCAEAHFWRPERPGEDIEDWRRQFMTAVMR